MQLAKYCEFDNIEKEIKSQLIQSCLSNKVRRKALHDSDATLQQILDFARAMDATDSHMTEIEKPRMRTDRLDAVRKHSNHKQHVSEKKVLFSQPKKVFSQLTKIAQKWQILLPVWWRISTLSTVPCNKIAIYARRRDTLRRYVYENVIENKCVSLILVLRWMLLIPPTQTADITCSVVTTNCV